MIPTTDTFIALAAFESYNEYGHQPETMPDGPNETERAQWDAHRTRLIDAMQRPPSYITSDGDSARFDHCAVTGMRGDCVTFTVVWL